MRRKKQRHKPGHAPTIFGLAVSATCLALAIATDSPEAPAKAAEVRPRPAIVQQARPAPEKVDSDAEFEHLLRAIEKVESHGNPHAVSKKGAKGRFQVMPATAKKPGMGVRPMRNHSDAEQERFARDYLKALLRKYDGNRKLVAAAYNSGAGRVDRLLAMLPKETREYVVKVEREYAQRGR